MKYLKHSRVPGYSDTIANTRDLSNSIYATYKQQHKTADLFVHPSIERILFVVAKESSS